MMVAGLARIGLCGHEELGRTLRTREEHEAAPDVQAQAGAQRHVFDRRGVLRRLFEALHGDFRCGIQQRCAASGARRCERLQRRVARFSSRALASFERFECLPLIARLGERIATLERLTRRAERNRFGGVADLAGRGANRGGGEGQQRTQSEAPQPRPPVRADVSHRCSLLTTTQVTLEGTCESSWTRTDRRFSRSVALASRPAITRERFHKTSPAILG